MAGAAGGGEGEAEVAEQPAGTPLGDVALGVGVGLRPGGAQQDAVLCRQLDHAVSVGTADGRVFLVADGHAHGAHATRRALAGALILTVAFGAAQVVAGLAFGSLALIADAVHNLADGGAIALALLAAWAATRPPTATHTYGWARLEILAALVNGVLLIALSAWIFWDAAVRLLDPPSVDGGGL